MYKLFVKYYGQTPSASKAFISHFGMYDSPCFNAELQWRTTTSSEGTEYGCAPIQNEGRGGRDFELGLFSIRVLYLSCFKIVIKVKRNLFRLRWKNATNELFSFSVACHQFRRISLPFLFSYIKIQRLEDLKMFKDQCISNASFAGSIRSLSVKLPWSDWDITSVIKHLLCYLKDLSQLNTYFRIDVPLLAELNRHSVKTIVVTSLAQLPKTSGYLDLEKIILANATMYGLGGDLDGYLARGMQVRSLVIPQDLMDNSSGMHKFNGLYEIEVQLKRTMSFAWFPGFTRTHPLLKKIKFTDGFDYLRLDNTIPFIEPLFEALRQQGVYNAVRIQGFSVTRSIPSTSATDMTDDWEVTGLHLRQVTDHLVLPIVHSLFPWISKLTLERGCGHIDELITFLRPFSSLRVLTLRFCFQFLELVYPRLSNHPQAPGESSDTEAGMIQHTSRIAREIPSIEAFYVEEQVNGVHDLWTLRGWIDAWKDMTEVLTMIRRRIVGVGIPYKHAKTTFFI
ncbi:hypothetical protein BT96DRAFT_945561 [Gymnopus androsaceus JB14]|uniref:Uncharacterized protein n=1 Tax=Gymnopus androsaceus JB14 TaxID=1447944 RepID=A0A6A4H0A9_9AGAR|nr:hypothetical protein BT96DRAFT_945561 [Gymnopus androsaceus JB14]